jgi:phosphate-selective porin OprO/OprP
MERALPTSLAPGLLRGAVLRTRGKHWSMAIGAFGNDLADEDRRKLNGRSALVRAVWQPVNGRSADLGFGISAETRRADAGATARIRARPESAPTDARLVDTGTLHIGTGISTLGADGYWSQGPLMLAAEYLQSRVVLADSAAPTSSTVSTLRGWTASAAWTLTGEHRGYRVATGSLAAIDPRHRWGALELAVRRSTLDLEDGTITGGVETNSGVALNWYWNRNSRLAVNYIRVDAQPNRRGIDESPTVLQARFQLTL